MREEFIYGIIAAFSWSFYVIILKEILKESSLKIVLLSLGLGVFLASIFSFILIKENNLSFNLKTILLSILAGILWFLGIISINYALKKGLNLSIMAPIYNLNTLIVVILSLILFKENVEYWKVILATILVTIASILLS